MELGLGECRRSVRVLRDVVLPFVGMTALWPLFRYASFIRVLYPAGTDVQLGGIAPSAHATFLVVLAALTLVCFVRWRAVSAFLDTRRLPVVLLISLASVASLLAAAAGDGRFAAVVLVLSIICAATGFLASFLAWGSYFARSWTALGPAVLGASFLASYLLFSAHGLVGGVAQGWVAAVIMPLMSALSWGFLAGSANTTGRRETDFSLTRCASPLLVAVASLLVVGGVVRGIVDMGRSSSVLRLQVSLVLSAILAIVCIAYWRRSVKAGTACLPAAGVGGEAKGRSEGHDRVASLLGVCWSGISLLFLAGLFLFLVMEDKHFGGDIVIVGRSSMEFVLWAVLCNLAAAKRMPPVPVFLAGGMSFMVVSWILSYVIVPAFLSAEVYEGVLTPNVIVLAVLFGFVGAGLLAFGFSATLRGRGGVLASIPADPGRPGLGEAPTFRDPAHRGPGQDARCGEAVAPWADGARGFSARRPHASRSSHAEGGGGHRAVFPGLQPREGGRAAGHDEGDGAEPYQGRLSQARRPLA